jgi:hypothetical protein
VAAIKGFSVNIISPFLSIRVDRRPTPLPTVLKISTGGSRKGPCHAVFMLFAPARVFFDHRRVGNGFCFAVFLSEFPDYGSGITFTTIHISNLSVASKFNL